MSAKIHGPLSFTSLAGFDGTGASQITPVANSIFLVRVDTAVRATEYIQFDDGGMEVIRNTTVTVDLKIILFVSDLVSRTGLTASNFYCPVGGYEVNEGIFPESGGGLLPERTFKIATVSATGLSFAATLDGDVTYTIPGGTTYLGRPVSGSRNTQTTTVNTVVPLCMFKSGW